MNIMIEILDFKLKTLTFKLFANPRPHNFREGL